MASETSSYEEDRELWRKLYKNFVFDNEELDILLEELSLYWNDDKAIVDTFVLKTIKRFNEEGGMNQQLLPEYKDDEDMEYAHRLFKATIQNAEEYRKMMSDNSKNWDMSRLAFMDVIIMQTALTEVMTFPQIPLNVTLNEYVEIAKYYSTPKSSSFINGLLDTITKKLKSENIINK
jgi:N utilization substance protein B